MRRHHFPYNHCLTIAFACILCARGGADAAEFSPYEARVTKAGAPIHSGPGENFYPTDTLAQGDSVEVYREKPDGWLAIRPPQNNFSWVLGSDVKLTGNGLGEIVKDGAPSRIGSRLNDQRNAVQVQLKQGETVEIIDEETIGGAIWYKISPPAGEFRWLHASSIERNAASKSESLAPIEPLKPLVDSSVATTADTSESSASPTSKIEPLAEATTTSQTTTAQWQASSPGENTAPAEVAAPPLAANTPVATAGTDSSTSTAPTDAPAKSTTPTETATANGTPAPSNLSVASVNDGLARELSAIEMRLSRMVAAPTQMWNTERLEQDAQQLLSKAQTTAERDAVKVTLDKIDRFASIGRRYASGEGGAGAGASANSAAGPPAVVGGSPPVVAGSPDPATSTTAGLPAGAGSGDPRTAATGTAAAATSPEAGRYDAIGVLRPVVSKRPGAPQFALVDERGQVISFVSPTPDVNLQPYLGHRVGVVGNRGFIPEFQRAHVTAGRIQPLNERILR